MTKVATARATDYFRSNHTQASIFVKFNDSGCDGIKE
jgi:hypothetical protein